MPPCAEFGIFGYRAVYAGQKGDRKARKEMNLFENWYKCTNICERCLACNITKQTVDKTLLYTDCSRTAPWRHTEIDHETYLETARRVSPWTKVPGYRLETSLGDIAHDLYQM